MPNAAKCQSILPKGINWYGAAAKIVFNKPTRIGRPMPCAAILYAGREVRAVINLIGCTLGFPAPKINVSGVV